MTNFPVAERRDVSCRTAGRQEPATIWSMALDPVAVIRQCGGQFNDPTPELLTEQIKLYFTANRNVLVSPQYRHPSTRNVTVELLHQVGHIDAGACRVPNG
jgi:hypothetical protein